MSDSTSPEDAQPDSNAGSRATSKIDADDDSTRERGDTESRESVTLDRDAHQNRLDRSREAMKRSEATLNDRVGGDDRRPAKQSSGSEESGSEAPESDTDQPDRPEAEDARRKPPRKMSDHWYESGPDSNADYPTVDDEGAYTTTASNADDDDAGDERDREGRAATDISSDSDSDSDAPATTGKSDRSRSASPDPSSPTIVAVGASAGGLKAFRRFLSAMPTDADLAFVLVQHLDPEHNSILPELLAKHTDMHVVEIENRSEPRPNTVHVIPQDVLLEIRDGRFNFVSRDDVHQSGRQAVDRFFKSLANQFGPRAIAIVLSGAGSDGAAGIRAVKAAGGLTIAQDEEEAEYDSMPRAAATEGAADRVLRCDEMAEIITRFAGHAYASPPAPSHASPESSERSVPPSSLGQDELARRIVSILGQSVAFNADPYKESTICRRVHRRMSLVGISSEERYLDYLEESGREARQLARDLLISVTDFFRDTEAFDAFAGEAANAIIDAAEERAESDDDLDAVRIWTPGCATGEESFSVAMILYDALHKRNSELRLQVFATDIDEDALAFARRARYSAESASRIPEQFKRRFMERLEDGRWLVKRSLRDCVTFARHNLLVDPPYGKLNCVVCRNLLIYLRRESQREAIDLFHFALSPGGVLFLGSSENPGGESSGFTPISKPNRIYRRVGRTKTYEVLQNRGRRIKETRDEAEEQAEAQKSVAEREERSLAETCRQAVLKHATPAAVVVDEHQQVVFTAGDLAPYLAFGVGEPTMDLSNLLIKPLRTRVRTAVLRAQREKDPQEVRVVLDGDDHQRRRIVSARVASARSDSGSRSDLLVIAFRDEPNASDEPLTTGESVNEQLERELAATKADLRDTVEQLETTNEELKSSNEEARSMNEELQSSNEELQASSEELRSLNEELTTVNVQLREKVDELEATNNDMRNLLTSTRLAVLFLDRSLCISRYTPEATRLIHVIESDIGRPVHDLRGACVDHTLLQDAEGVLEGLTPSEREVEDENGRWYARRILPYRTDEDRIAGVVVVFNDITEKKVAADTAAAKARQQATVARLGLRAMAEPDLDVFLDEAIREATAVLDADFGKVLRYDDERDDFLVLAGLGWNDHIVPGEALVPAAADSQGGYTLRAPDPVVVTDLHAERRFAGPQLLLDHHVRSGVSCAIRPGDKPFGVIGLHSTNVRTFTDDDADFVQSVANIIASAVKLRESQRRLRRAASESKRREAEIEALYQATPVGLCVFDRDLRFVRINQEMADINGFSVDAHLGRRPEELFTSLADTALPLLQRVLDTGEPILNLEVTGDTPATRGENRTWIASYLPIYEEGEDAPTGVSVVVLDITERHRAEAAIRDNERRLAMITSSMTEGLIISDPDGNVLEFNQAAAELHGINRDEARKAMAEFATRYTLRDEFGRETPVAQWPLARALRGERFENSLYQVVDTHRDTAKWFAYAGTPVYHEPDEPNADQRTELQYAIVTLRDVTEQHAAERARAESERRFRDLAESMPSIVFVADHDGRISFVNRQWHLLTGVIKPDDMQLAFFAVLHPEDREWVQEAWNESVETREEFEIEFRIADADGDYRWHLARAVPIHEQRGDFAGWYGAAHDVHELREGENRERLLRHELDHRLKNTMATVLSMAMFTIRETPDPEEFGPIFESRLRSMSRVHELLAAAGWHGAHLRQVVDTVVKPWNNGDDTRVSIHGVDCQLTAKGGLTLGMVLHELATNAAKYGSLSADQGSVDITINCAPDDDDRNMVELVWHERGGPPVVDPPVRRYGTRLIENAGPYELSGESTLEFRPDGLYYRVVFPADID